MQQLLLSLGKYESYQRLLNIFGSSTGQNELFNICLGIIFINFNF